MDRVEPGPDPSPAPPLGNRLGLDQSGSQPGGERFKIRRQVRVHTAHGRFTGYVLLALPAFLGIALMFINPDLMQLLFRERMGQMLLAAAMVLQVIGFFWIRNVIRIEV